MTEKENLHRLIEELPDNELYAAQRFLEFLCSRNDPFREVKDPPAESEPAASDASPVYVALNPDTPEQILEKLANDVDNAVRAAVATNPRTPREVLARLAADADHIVRQGVMRNLQASSDAYRQVIEATPGDTPEVHYSMAMTYEMARRFEEAAAEYAKHLEIKPLDAEAHCRLGNVFVILKMNDEAIAEYKQASRINPQLAEPHYRLGDLYSELVNWAAAMQEYQEALKLEPTNKEAKRGLANAQTRSKQAQKG